jgi:hypothetical protein
MSDWEMDGEGIVVRKVVDLANEDHAAVADIAAEERIRNLEYEVSGLTQELKRVIQLLAERIEDDKESEGWRGVYRFHQPEMKGGEVKITTAERREGHLYERGYVIEIRDISGEEPRLRVRRA